MEGRKEYEVVARDRVFVNSSAMDGATLLRQVRKVKSDLAVMESGIKSEKSLPELAGSFHRSYGMS